MCEEIRELMDEVCKQLNAVEFVKDEDYCKVSIEFIAAISMLLLGLEVDSLIKDISKSGNENEPGQKESRLMLKFIADVLKTSLKELSADQ